MSILLAILPVVLFAAMPLAAAIDHDRAAAAHARREIVIRRLWAWRGALAVRALTVRA